MKKRFRCPLLVGLLVAVCSCSGSTTEDGPPAGTAESTDRSSVNEAHESFVRALEERDVDALAATLDRSAEFQLFLPTVASRIDTIDEAVRGFETMFRSLGTVEWTEVHSMVNVYGEAAWRTSYFLLESPELEEAFVGRATEVWIRRVDEWKLVHGHWSAEPSGP